MPDALRENRRLAVVLGLAMPIGAASAQNAVDDQGLSSGEIK